MTLALRQFSWWQAPNYRSEWNSRWALLEAHILHSLLREWTCPQLGWTCWKAACVCTQTLKHCHMLSVSNANPEHGPETLSAVHSHTKWQSCVCLGLHPCENLIQTVCKECTCFWLLEEMGTSAVEAKSSPVTSCTHSQNKVSHGMAILVGLSVSWLVGPL